MSKKLKTRKKRYKKHKSKRSKSKSKRKRKRIKRSKRMALKGGSQLVAAGVVAAAAAAAAAGGLDGPRKCIFGDCQSHYYHFYGLNTGWWDSTEGRNFKGQTRAEWLGDASKGGENNKICPNCVKRNCKPCSTTRCTNQKCDRLVGQLVPPPGDRPGDWWELDEGVYKKISEYRHIEWSGGIYCPKCSVMYKGGRVCDKCKKPLNDYEPRKGDNLNYCDDCKKGFLAEKDTFSFRGLEYGIDDKLRYNEEGRQYEATIMGIYDGIGDDNYKGTQVLALTLNKWNGLLGSTASVMGRTITVIGELQISLRLLSFAKLLDNRRYDLAEDIIIYIKEKIREKISEYINVEPWVRIDDPSRAEYKEILISEWKKHKKDQLEAIAEDGARYWAGASR
jgi:hypothetical protein